MWVKATVSTNTNLNVKHNIVTVIVLLPQEKIQIKCLFFFSIYGCCFLVNGVLKGFWNHISSPDNAMWIKPIKVILIDLTYHLHTHNTLQTITINRICLERPTSAGHKKKRVAPQWKILTLFVQLPQCGPVGVGVLIIIFKKASSYACDTPVIHSTGSQYSSGLLLPGQASPDFSHGSEPLGQTAAAISPLTLFHEWSNGSQVSLRKLVCTVH